MTDPFFVSRGPRIRIPSAGGGGGGSGLGGVSAKLTLAASPDFNHGIDGIVVPLDTVAWDDASFYSAPDTGFVIPRDGKYLVLHETYLGSGTANMPMSLTAGICKNGETYPSIAEAHGYEANTGEDLVAIGSEPVALLAGDVLQLKAFYFTADFSDGAYVDGTTFLAIIELGGGAFHGAFLYQTAPQNTEGFLDQTNLGLALVDTDLIVNGGSNGFVIPASLDGHYVHLWGQVSVGIGPDFVPGWAVIQVNSSDVAAFAAAYAGQSSGDYGTWSPDRPMIQVFEGDVIDLWFIDNSGSTHSIYSGASLTFLALQDLGT